MDDQHLDGQAAAAGGRRRARRTTVGALAVVVLLGGAMTWAVPDRGSRVEVVDRPAPSETPTSSAPATDDLEVLLGLPTPPPIPDEVVQPRWDPRTANDLPVLDLGLPTRLDPPDDAPELSSTAAAVVMVEDEDEGGVSLVDAEGGWWHLPAPEAAFRMRYDFRTYRMSTDGTRVVFLGRTALWSRDVRATRWRRLPYPDGFVRRKYHLPEVLPLDAGRIWLGRGNRSWLVDVDRARVEEYRVSLQSTVWGGGDTYVATSDAFDPPMNVLSVGPMGAPRRSFRTDALGTLSSVVADTRSLAAVRGACVGSGPQQRGLMALALDDLSTRGYLGIRDPTLTFTCGSALQAVAWVDPDTVLGSAAALLPAHGLGRRTLFTWDVETGDLHRASSLPAGVSYDVAGDLLSGGLVTGLRPSSTNGGSASP